MINLQTFRFPGAAPWIAAQVLLLASTPLHANTYVVTDPGGGPGPDTLHEAITNANNHAGPDTVDLRSVSGTIHLTGPLPTITGDTTILGDGDITIDGQSQYRHIDVERINQSTDIDVRIESVIFEHGVSDNSGAARDYWGGSIRVQGSINLTLRNCVFRGNQAADMGGALLLYVSGLLVENCSFVGNSAGTGGAIAYAGSPRDMRIFRNCTFARNTAAANGGAILLNVGQPSFVHCTIANNKAGTNGGGVYADYEVAATFQYCAIAGNTAANGGADVAAGPKASIVYSGHNVVGGDPKLAPLGLYHHAFLPTFNLLPGSPLRNAALGSATTTDQRGVARPQQNIPDIGAFEAKVYYVDSFLGNIDTGPGSLREAIASGPDIIDMGFSSGYYIPATPLPGLDGVVLAGPGADKYRIQTTADAPVFEIRNAGPVVVQGIHIGPTAGLSGSNRHGVFVQNSTIWLLGCLFTQCSDYNDGSCLGAFDSEVKISSCTFSNNDVRIGSGIVSLGDSAALVENSTFSGNQARQGGDAGAISAYDSGLSRHESSLVINHCTFYDNTADGDGNHLWIGSTMDSATMKNSLMLAGGHPQIHDPGHKLALDSNFFGNSATGIIDTSLESNGGATPTHRLLSGALPIDDARAPGSPETDQRGVARHNEGPLPDIGAYEFVSGKYLRWLASHFGYAGFDSGDGFFSSPIHCQDPDGDGATNIEEFLFNTDPAVPDAGQGPCFVKDTSSLLEYGGISFRENFDAPGEIGYAVERSADMASWTPQGMTPANFSPVFPGYAQVSYFSSTPMGGALGIPQEFYRVRVRPPVDAPVMACVRDPGNSADANGRGAVAETYRIGVHEVTNAEYTRFLNAVNIDGADPLDIYSQTNRDGESANGINFDAAAPDGQHYSVKDGFAQLPVVLIDYWNAVRYANWRHNGAAPGSDTENGAYSLEGHAPTPTNANTLAGRNPGARFFLPNVDEWYKAAYYTGSGHYATYPTCQEDANNDPPPGDEQSANYDNSAMRPAGSYPAARSHCLACDMGGNADEFIEKSATGDNVLNIGGRFDGTKSLLSSASWNSVSSATTARYRQTGFRIASTKE